MKMKLSEITVPNGRRDIDYVKVSELAASIKIVGLINPITVSRDGTLIAGLHRLEACRCLGFDEIECVVLDCDELRTELAEIDENLVRNDLDSVRIGELAIRRDEILDALGVRAPAHRPKKGAGTAPLRTTADIAKESGISERTLQENKQLAKNLVPEAKKAVREKAIPKSTALEISRLEPEEQRKVVAQKDKKAISAAVREKRQTNVHGATPPRRKTLAESQEPEEAIEYLKIPLPIDHMSMANTFGRRFQRESTEVKDHLLHELALFIDLIQNIHCD